MGCLTGSLVRRASSKPRTAVTQISLRRKPKAEKRMWRNKRQVQAGDRAQRASVGGTLRRPTSVSFHRPGQELWNLLEAACDSRVGFKQI